MGFVAECTDEVPSTISPNDINFLANEYNDPDCTEPTGNTGVISVEHIVGEVYEGECVQTSANGTYTTGECRADGSYILQFFSPEDDTCSGEVWSQSTGPTEYSPPLCSGFPVDGLYYGYTSCTTDAATIGIGATAPTIPTIPTIPPIPPIPTIPTIPTIAPTEVATPAPSTDVDDADAANTPAPTIDDDDDDAADTPAPVGNADDDVMGNTSAPAADVDDDPAAVSPSPATDAGDDAATATLAPILDLDDVAAADSLAPAASVDDDVLDNTSAPAAGDGSGGVSVTAPPTAAGSGSGEVEETTSPIRSGEAALANGVAGTGSGVAVGTVALSCAMGLLVSTAM